mmetsp:Transcript_8835/g.29543  ORF Transcript_8835/g.29543 Transcript_8835/m.29543 type:complete len:110 (+) Transcript_8835:2-331(+)
MFAMVDLLGSQWAEQANAGMFGNNSTSNFGEPSSLGSFSKDSYVLGHTNLPSGWMLSATNWGGAPGYRSLGMSAPHMIPSEAGNGRSFPVSESGRAGRVAYRMIQRGFR